MTTHSLGQLSDAAQRLLIQRLSGRGHADDEIRIGSGVRAWPLSSDQRRLWFMHELRRTAVEYNVDAAFRVRGPLSVRALRQAFESIVDRHEVLRTRIQIDRGEPYLVVGGVPPDLMSEHDLTAEADPLAGAARLARETATRPFNLGRGPLLVVWVARLGPDDHAFGFVVHHIVFDRESLDILLRELAAGLRASVDGSPPGRPALPASFGDFASWQRQRAVARAREADRAYWRQRLRNVPVMLELPADRPRPAAPSHVAGEVAVRVAAGAAQSLRSIARRYRTTVFVPVLAAFQGVLLRHCPGVHAVVGCPFSARSRVEFEPLIGFFARSLPVVADLTGRSDPTFATLITMARDAMLEAHTHQELPFDEIVAMVDPPRDLGHNPVFQVWFDLMPEAASQVPWPPGLEVTTLPTGEARTRFDMELHMTDLGSGGLGGRLLYAVDLFDRETALDFVGHFERFVAHAASAPDTALSQIPLLTDSERDMIVNRWSAARSVAPS